MKNLDYLVECNFTNKVETIDPQYICHPKYELFLLLEGQASMLINAERYPLTRGSLVLLSSDDWHLSINESNQPYSRVTMHFDPNIIQMYNTERTNLLDCFTNARSEHKHIIQLTEEEIEQYLDTAKRIAALWGSAEFGDDLTAIAMLIRHLIVINKIYWRETGTSPLQQSPLVHQIVTYVDSHIDSPMSISALAEECRYSKSHISTTFSHEMGIPIRRYILVKKILYAKTLLAQGHTVEYVCANSGFNDYCNFIRTFKSIVGIAPKQWQSQMKEKEKAKATKGKKKQQA